MIIFDEIQACPKALTSLKYFAENLPQLAVCCAGSLLGLHLGPVSFPVGKVNFLELLPCSFLEFLRAIREDALADTLDQWPPKGALSEVLHLRFWDQLKAYFICGGLPEVVAHYAAALGRSRVETFHVVRQAQQSLIKSYLADVAKHSGKVNSMHIDRVWCSVATQLSQQHDLSSEKFRFRGVVPGVEGYARLVGAIDWLKSAGLVIDVPVNHRAHEPLKAYTTENAFKLMMFDIGIFGAMVGLAPETLYAYDFGTYKGYFAENYVAQSLHVAGHTALFSWREKTAEIEFLIQQNGEIIPIEVKSALRTKAQSLRSYIDKYRPSRSIILSGKNYYRDPKSNTEYWPLYAAMKI